MCSAGYETIGVGRNISESGLGLSDDEIEYLLVNDIRRCRKELTQEYEWFSSLDSVRQDAIIDLSFNLGQTRLRTFVKALGHMATTVTTKRLDKSFTVAVGLNRLATARWKCLPND
jgi:GH24 family phage-related lysozyme (muramidase)